MQILFLQSHHQVKQQVSSLGNNRFFLMIFAGQHKFCGFFAHFFQDPVLAAMEQLRDVGLAGISLPTLMQGTLQAVENAAWRRC